MNEELMEKIEEVFEEEHKELLEDLERFKKFYREHRTEIQRLERENKHLNDVIDYDIHKKNISDKAKAALVGLTSESENMPYNSNNPMIQLIKSLFTETHPREGFDSECPIWFVLAIKYYNNRETIFDIMEYFEFSFPAWARDVRLPYDYTKEEIIYYLKNTNAITNTNSTHFDRNMRFWYENNRSKLARPIDILDGRSFSSNVPWQYLLKNKLLIEDEEVFEFFLEALKDSSRGGYFIKVCDYQEIPADKIVRICKASTSDYRRKLIEKNIESIDDESVLDWFYTTEEYKFSQTFPKKFHYYELERQEDYLAKIYFIHSDEKFTAKEKQQLINEVNEAHYSDAIIAEKTLMGEKI